MPGSGKRYGERSRSRLAKSNSAVEKPKSKPLKQDFQKVEGTKVSPPTQAPTESIKETAKVNVSKSENPEN